MLVLLAPQDSTAKAYPHACHVSASRTQVAHQLWSMPITRQRTTFNVFIRTIRAVFVSIASSVVSQIYGDIAKHAFKIPLFTACYTQNEEGDKMEISAAMLYSYIPKHSCQCSPQKVV